LNRFGNLYKTRLLLGEKEGGKGGGEKDKTPFFRPRAVWRRVIQWGKKKKEKCSSSPPGRNLGGRGREKKFLAVERRGERERGSSSPPFPQIFPGEKREGGVRGPAYQHVPQVQPRKGKKKRRNCLHFQKKGKKRKKKTSGLSVCDVCGTKKALAERGKRTRGSHWNHHRETVVEYGGGGGRKREKKKGGKEPGLSFLMHHRTQQAIGRHKKKEKERVRRAKPYRALNSSSSCRSLRCPQGRGKRKEKRQMDPTFLPNETYCFQEKGGEKKKEKKEKEGLFIICFYYFYWGVGGTGRRWGEKGKKGKKPS